MDRRQRILFVGESASLAHVTRPLVLASALDATRYDVRVAFGADRESLFDGHPDITFHRLEGSPVERVIRESNQGGFVPQPDEIEAKVDAERALYAEIAPDLIVNDFRHTISISAPLAGIAYASLANVYWSPHRDLGFDPIAPIPEPHPLRKLLRRLRPRRVYSATASFNHVRARYGLRPMDGFLDLVTQGAYTLYLEPEGFVPTGVLPSTHRFVGPPLWSPDPTRPPWWGRWDEGLPLIYVTMGSTGRSRILPDLLARLARLPANVVASTAGRIEVRDPPEGVYVADYLPGLEVSRLADLVVCNGGSPTAYQALQGGTPVLGLWSNIDQYLNMMTLVRHGAGRALRVADATLDDIAGVSEELLRGAGYRESALVLSELFGGCDAKERFRTLAPEILSATASRSG